MSSSLGIDRLIERQLRNWELARAQRLAADAGDDDHRVEQFVALSREVGCDAGTIGKLLSERLGWPVFDKELLDQMAENDAIRARLYERMDERDTTFVEAVLRVLLMGDFGRSDYFRRLSETVLALARQGRAVFVGRGADLILPREYGLRVRLVAPLERRVSNFAQRYGCDEDTARLRIERIQRDRADFVQHHFRRAPEDMTRFDLTLNIERFTPQQAVDLLLFALRQRGVIA
ncbi:MAG: cytidylate kinase-like family protein [Phycisphaerae bacterium]|jgi:cytidylate kinase